MNKFEHTNTHIMWGNCVFAYSCTPLIEYCRLCAVCGHWIVLHNFENGMAKSKENNKIRILKNFLVTGENSNKNMATAATITKLRNWFEQDKNWFKQNDTSSQRITGQCECDFFFHFIFSQRKAATNLIRLFFSPPNIHFKYIFLAINFSSQHCYCTFVIRERI